jgi:hypothetical protein
MGITEELKSLEELRTKGTLTDPELTAAKAAAIASHGKADSLKSLGRPPKPQKKSSTSRVLIFVLILVALGGWSFIQHRTGGSGCIERVGDSRTAAYGLKERS